MRYLIDEAEIDKIMRNDSVTKLFYQKSTNYADNTSNWGNTKGSRPHSRCMCRIKPYDT